MNTLSQINSIEQVILGKVSKAGQSLLVLTVGAVLLMLIVPLPTLLLDFLIALNMVGALGLLLVSINISDSIRLTSFPTLLLLCTLFRLGLNLSSTRLILGHGYAGEIIQTFGLFATSGNLVVGLVLFAILSLIQFIVIAKGAERVAEVGARFTLDALPGKQMSIDADLRAGLISQEEAKELREKLHREAKMYGAMDGAMKFVKGDVIAGLLITFVNLIGGLAIGVMQRGFSLTEAAHTYSILSIGDGLVNQIPAILVSITAGFVVTRVADEKAEKSLGQEIGHQILSQPKALLTASGLSLLMGFIPGFPLALFALVAAGLASGAFYIINTIKKKSQEPQSLESHIIEGDSIENDELGQSIPLVLEVGPELYKVFKDDPRWQHCFGQLYPRLRNLLSNQLGVVFPELKLSINPNLSQSYNYRIQVFQIPVDRGVLSPKHCALLGDVPTAAENFTEPEKISETVHGTKLNLWDLNRKNWLAQNGLSVYGPEEIVLRHLAKVLKKHAGDFLGIQEVRNLLTLVEKNHPELVREVVPKMMSIQKLTDISKRLVEEGVPIKDFRLVLQTLAYSQPESKDPVTLTEQVRIGLRRTITFLHTKEGNTLSAFTVDPDIEEEVRQGIQKNGSECYLALPPERIRFIQEAFRGAVDSWRYKAGQDKVILATLDVRRYVKKIIEQELPDTPVLSYQELDPQVIINQLGSISFGNSTPALRVVGA